MTLDVMMEKKLLPFKSKKQKKRDVPTKEDIRLIIKEELLTVALEQKKISEEEKARKLKRQKLDSLPKSTKLQLIRYLKKREEKHGRK